MGEGAEHYHAVLRYASVILIVLLASSIGLQYPAPVRAASPPIKYGGGTVGESKPANFVLTLPWADTVKASGIGSAYGDGLHTYADSYAIDFDLPENTNIVAAAPGTVIWAGDEGLGYGYSVLIAHTGPGAGYVSLYAHLKFIASKFTPLIGPGGIGVARGEVIGQQGMSGRNCCPHLHFALYRITDASLLHVGPNTHPNYVKMHGSIAVVPEPILGEEAYENLFWLSPANGFQTSMDIIAHRAKWQFQDGPSQMPSSPNSTWVKPSLTSQRVKYGQALSIEATVTNSIPTAEVRLTAEYWYPTLGSNPYWNHNTGNFTRSPEFPGDKIWRIVARCTGTGKSKQCSGAGSYNNGAVQPNWVGDANSGTFTVYWNFAGEKTLIDPIVGFIPNAKMGFAPQAKKIPNPSPGTSVQLCLSIDVISANGVQRLSPSGGVRCGGIAPSKAAVSRSGAGNDSVREIIIDPSDGGGCTVNCSPPPSGIVTVISAYPSNNTFSRGQSFNPDVVVQTSGVTLDCNQDFLKNTDGNLYSGWPNQGCVSLGGNQYKFHFNTPMIAPSSPGTYHSQWQIWHYPNLIGPVIDLSFNVEQPQTDGVQLCADQNYGGCRPPITYANDSTCIGLGDLYKQVSSLRFIGSYSKAAGAQYHAIMYNDTNCQTYLARYIAEDQSQLGGLDNTFGSMRIERHTAPAYVTVYSDPNGGGDRRTYPYEDDNKCIPFPELHDNVSSLSFSGTYDGSQFHAVMYHDMNCQTFLARYYNQGVGSLGLLDNQFNSMRIEKHPCYPTGYEAAIFTEPNWMGQCVVFPVGQSANSSAFHLPNDSIQSVRVGAYVQLALYRDENFQGTSETLTRDDFDLSDNTIGTKTVSSIRIIPAPPLAPGTPSPPDGGGFNQGQDVTLAWATAINAAEYSGEWWGADNVHHPFGWQAAKSRDIGMLDTGTYLWHVKARDAQGESAWSPIWTFTIRPAQAKGAPAYGTGADGDLTVASGQTVYTDTVRTTVSGTPAAGQQTLTLANAAGIAAGDEILLTQMYGDLSVGTYEFATVTGVQGNQLTLAKPLANAYNPGTVPSTACPNGFMGQYFANENRSGTPVYSQCDPAINFDWGNGGPANLAADHFSVRWTGTFNFVAGIYRFDLASDDASTLIVDGQEVAWAACCGPTWKTIELPAGNHTLELDYTENTGAANVHLGISLGGLTQVVRVPQYKNVTVQDGGVLTLHPWDGSTGGILAFRAKQQVTVATSGVISASARGYRGGRVFTFLQGYQGESYAGLGGWARFENGGGGGGADTNANDRHASAGGGGYGTAGADGTVEAEPDKYLALGGRSYGASDLSTLAFGSGGGSGDSVSGGGDGGDGGNGGGVIYIAAPTLDLSGSIQNVGGNGGTGRSGSHGGGGGGAGGSILLQGNTIHAGTVVANGGTGGNAVNAPTRGGNGGAGRIRFEYCTALTGQSTPAASTRQLLCGSGPAVASLDTSQGPLGGGTAVTLTGSGFAPGVTVTFGGVTATSVSVTSTTAITATTPAHAAGLVDIVVTNPDGQSAILPRAFTYKAMDTAGSLVQVAELVGTGSVGDPRQGSSVAVSADGTTALVGARNDNGSVGAVYVFVRSGGAWVQQGSKLTGNGTVGIALFGASVALSSDGNTALIGAYNDNNFVGAAFVFTRSNGIWSQQGSKLTGAGEAGVGRFGCSVALSADGNTALIGGYADNNGVGAAFLFTRTGGTWTQQGSKLTPAGAVGNSIFGWAVALSSDGNTALVSGYQDNGLVGAAFVFTRTGAAWSQQQKLTGGSVVGQALFGFSVALASDGNTALIGAYDDNGSIGAAFVFTRTGAAWSQQGSKLIGSGEAGAAQFGSAVALSADGNTALIGAHFDGGHAGAAFVFGRTGGVWAQQGTKLGATGTAGQAPFGSSVSLSADGYTAVIGAYDDAVQNIGAAFVFVASSNVTPLAGTTPQSARAGTAFFTALAVHAPAGTSLTFTAPGTGASGTFPGGATSVTVTADASGVATAPTFTANSVLGAYRVTAVAGVGPPATFDLTNVSAETLLAVGGFPGTQTAGVAGSVTVTATDTSGNPATGYTGTVRLTSSDPQAALPATYTFTQADRGVHVFTVTLRTAGTQSITATDIAAGSTTGTQASIKVVPALTGVSPASGEVAGGTRVTLRGAGFTAGATVTFGGVAGTDVTVEDSTTITVTAPAHAAGQVDVVVTAGGASATLSGAFTYGSTGTLPKPRPVGPGIVPQGPTNPLPPSRPAKPTAPVTPPSPLPPKQ